MVICLMESREYTILEFINMFMFDRKMNDGRGYKNLQKVTIICLALYENI